MRTTITLPDKLIQETLAISGKKRLSEAVAVALDDYISLKKRLALLDRLFDHPVPHSFKKIKQDRRRGGWVAE